MCEAELIEALAAIEHQRWSDWQSWVHSLCERRDDGCLVIPADDAARWERQIATNYEQLSEREKQADRDQVARYLPLICPCPHHNPPNRPHDESAETRDQVLL